MDDKEFPKLLVEYIEFYESNQFEIVEQDRTRLDQSEDIISDFIEMFNESLFFKERERIFWLIFRYGARDNFKLLFEWINHGLATSNSQEKLDNLGESQENILKFLIENELISQIQIQDLIKKLKRREIGGYPDRPRKLLEFHLGETSKKIELEANKPNSISYKLMTKYHALAFIFECHALGNNLPSGKKTELERIGNERLGSPKGHRFYRYFNEIIQKDLNVITNLIEIAGEEWKDEIMKNTKYQKEIQKYLQSKGL